MAPNPVGGGGGWGRGGGVFQGGGRKEQGVRVARERQGNEEIRKFLSFYKRKNSLCVDLYLYNRLCYFRVACLVSIFQINIDSTWRSRQDDKSEAQVWG